MRKNKNTIDEIRYSDSILTDDRGMVRLSELNPQTRIKVRGRYIVAKNIPLSAYFLDCNHSGQGIAIAEGQVIFCESCKETRRVASARS